MSEGALIWVDGLTGLDVTSKFILNRMASFADIDDCVWVRVADLVQQTGASERTVQYRLRNLEKAGHIKRTERLHRIGTRVIPIYELQVDHVVVADVLRDRKDRRNREAETRAMGARPAPIADAVCTPMGATVCTPYEPIRDSELADANSTRARAPEGVAEAIWEGWPAAGRAASSRRLVERAVRDELAAGADPDRVLAGATAYAADRKAWGSSGRPLSPHKFLTDGCWETHAPVASAAKGSARARTGFACDQIRDALVAVKGAPWVISWLDPCSFDAASGVIDPGSSTRAARLRERDVLAILSGFQVQVRECG